MFKPYSVLEPIWNRKLYKVDLELEPGIQEPRPKNGVKNNYQMGS